MKTVYLVLENWGHEPSTVWGVCTTREIALSIADKLPTECDIAAHTIEIKETPLDVFTKQWLNS